MTAEESRNKIIDYLDKQFWKHKQYEQMPENDTGYEYVPREALAKIVDGLIPLMKPYVKDQYASTKAEEELEKFMITLDIKGDRKVIRKLRRYIIQYKKQ